MKHRNPFILLGTTVLSLSLIGCSGDSSPKEYTVTFDSQGGSEVAPVVVKEGEKVNKPDNPTKEDQTFVAWYEEVELIHEFDFETPITKAWTLYAGWKDIEYTVTFDSQGGSEVAPVVVKKGQTVAEPTTPEKENHEFLGWYLETEAINRYDFSSPVNANLTLYAGWKHIEYTVTFDSQGGSEVASITVKRGASISEPEEPEKKYYDFLGWYKEAGLINKYDFSTPVMEDMTLYAGWNETPAEIAIKTAVFADVQLCAKESGSGYVGNAGSVAHAYLSLKNHLELCKKQGADVLFMVGDITNNAIEKYYELYEETFEAVFGTDESQYPEVVWTMGNHEWWDIAEHETAVAVNMFKRYARIGETVKQSSVPYYLDANETLPTYYKVIKGVPYLIISGENSAGYIGDTMKEEIRGWLEEIAQLESVRDGGPIYVGYHYPLHTTLTHGSHAADNAYVLEELLKDYPTAIVFTGDTHYSGVNERAINQVEFTTINIGSSSYSRMDTRSATMSEEETFYNMKIKGGKTSDLMVGNANYKSEYTPTIHFMNTYENFNTTIDRYFSTDNPDNPTHINKAWNIPRGSNKGNFEYTNERIQNVAAAQDLYGEDGVSWEENAELHFGVKDGQMTVHFPDTKQYHYTEHFQIDVTGDTTKTYDVVSNYYKYNTQPENLYFVLDDLPSGNNYVVKVTAFDYFDNPSINYLESSTNEVNSCAESLDNAITLTYCDISTRLYFDNHAEENNSSVEYYYNGVLKYSPGAILNRLLLNEGDSAAEYLSIGNQDNVKTVVKAKVNNLSPYPIILGLTVVNGKGEWKSDFSQPTRQEVPANSGWVELSWDLTTLYGITGRSSMSNISIKASSPEAYNPDQGYEMHFLMDDVDIIADGAAEIIRGEVFSNGYAKDINPISLTDNFVIDIKFTSAEDTTLFIMLGDGWSAYFGYFKIYGDGSLDSTYNGVTVSDLEDGYHRYTFDLDQLTLMSGNPSKVNLIYIHGSWTTATGYIDINPQA